MVRFYLSDLLKRCNYNLNRTLLIRHSTNHERFVKAYAEGSLREYTQHQDHGFFDKFDIVIVFSADKSTTARYLKSYEVKHGELPHTSKDCAKFLLEPYNNNIMHPLFEMNNDPLSEYENKLFIDWGKGMRYWQKATNEKPITQLSDTTQYKFPGFENVSLTYNKLKEMVINGDDTYKDWHIALSSINAIYAIADCSNGKLYVGSSYNKNGLLGRWKEYVHTIHGGNNKLIRKHNQDAKAHLQFQFSILKVLPKDVTQLEAVEVEKRYKEKLQTIKYGYNEN
ncbi:GIY-YIG nuclease family protein [Bacillus cereus]|uniref:GIY-YIG nuclease family protein n=1 Tax=Bacillus cereus TaxID=1396 RepID=UPI0005A35F70|nr:GIY-YIG nuclease family protein [Bacillus cereus]AJG56695.1 GIY-YIG catalytic domain protein [Bacillus cereus D17]QKI10615.1 GIY-YIG nuclease family protein [Bacillus cereus]